MTTVILIIILVIWSINGIVWFLVGLATISDDNFKPLKINRMIWKMIIILTIFGPFFLLFLIKSKNMMGLAILYVYQKLTFGVGTYSNGITKFTGVILFGYLIGTSVSLSGFPNESFCRFNVYSDKEFFLPSVYRLSGVGLSKYEIPGCLPNPKKIKKYKSKNKLL